MTFQLLRAFSKICNESPRHFICPQGSSIRRQLICEQVCQLLSLLRSHKHSHKNAITSLPTSLCGVKTAQMICLMAIVSKITPILHFYPTILLFGNKSQHPPYKALQRLNMASLAYPFKNQASVSTKQMVLLAILFASGLFAW